ncbi:MAG: hypothetical protein PV340_00355 [Wolbachia sp.]|nr:hypothetical protein [Wolbachia sp.]
MIKYEKTNKNPIHKEPRIPDFESYEQKLEQRLLKKNTTQEHKKQEEPKPSILSKLKDLLAKLVAPNDKEKDKTEVTHPGSLNTERISSKGKGKTNKKGVGSQVKSSEVEKVENECHTPPNHRS